VVLSNVEIVNALKRGDFKITNLAGSDPSEKPFNTSAVDLRLGDEITVPSSENFPAALDLTKSGVAKLWAKHSQTFKITSDQPYKLIPKKFVIANTREKVSFPLFPKGTQCYSARVEGKSSLSRCGLLVHFTAPTIHAGFSGPITLEIINFGPVDFVLSPSMYICQLIIEEIRGCPADATSQFHEQINPIGEVKEKKKKKR
jgi:dCTP deaminase